MPLRNELSGPRILLRQLRDLMASPLGPQARLDKIVAAIAQNMVAEVCSIYVLRADGKLELFATQGLNPDAVHKSVLEIGEGLVGTIAASSRALNLTDAQSHPAFQYLPETGEEIYNSFLGVPILRAGRALGVAVVQNQTKRQYRDDEMEALETVAMVIAEMLATGEMSDLGSDGATLDLRKSMTISGLTCNDGIGLGHVVLHDPRVVVTNLFSDDYDYESQRLQKAIGSLQVSIDDMLSSREVDFEGEHRAVLEAYRMFAHDQGWARRLDEAISNGLTAEAAVEKVQSDMRARMSRMADPYLRERLSDFDDLANRLLRQLLGQSGPVEKEFPADAIIVARSMGAAELLDYPRDRLWGLVLEEGAPTSHVVIVARAMGIPVIAQAKNVVSYSEDADAIIIDGDLGQVHLRPQADFENSYADKVRFRAKRQEVYRDLRDKPATSRDGQTISLNMNCGLLVDLPQLDESGADGIGLFRTELPFMVASTMPRADQQEKLYREVLDHAGDRPVTFRTLDIGGDKIVSFMNDIGQEENPAMGLRAIRLTLERPALLRTQIRAMLKAAGGRNLKLMLPMVTDLGEVREARAIIDREIKHLAKFAHTLPKSLSIGVMLEVPSLLYQLDGLFELVDFVSVGSNDLFQFTMASDRANAKLNRRYDVLSPAFLRVLRSIVEAANRAGKPVTICGEIAGRTVSALALLGVGFRSMSMAGSTIGPVKSMILDVNIAELAAFMQPLIDNDGPDIDIRARLIDFAETRNIAL